jgi:hypothetical protein
MSHTINCPKMQIEQRLRVTAMLNLDRKVNNPVIILHKFTRITTTYDYQINQEYLVKI